MTSLLVGNTIASLGISMLIRSGLGCFALTAGNMALANWFGITVGTAGMILEIIMLLLATYLGEGIGLTSIVNAIYGSVMIDVFSFILPSNPLMIIGLLIIPFGWVLMGRAAYGDTGSNILMNALLKKYGLSISFMRSIQEIVFLSLGLLGAREYVTWFTIALTFGLGYLLQVVYKFMRYDPTEINHSFIIKRGH
jgi:uncharacterized membrane protein YczE